MSSNRIPEVSVLPVLEKEAGIGRDVFCDDSKTGGDDVAAPLSYAATTADAMPGNNEQEASLSQAIVPYTGLSNMANEHRFDTMVSIPDQQELAKWQNFEKLAKLAHGSLRSKWTAEHEHDLAVMEQFLQKASRQSEIMCENNLHRSVLTHVEEFLYFKTCLHRTAFEYYQTCYYIVMGSTIVLSALVTSSSALLPSKEFDALAVALGALNTCLIAIGQMLELQSKKDFHKKAYQLYNDLHQAAEQKLLNIMIASADASNESLKQSTDTDADVWNESLKQMRMRSTFIPPESIRESIGDDIKNFVNDMEKKIAEIAPTAPPVPVFLHRRTECIMEQHQAAQKERREKQKGEKKIREHKVQDQSRDVESKWDGRQESYVVIAMIWLLAVSIATLLTGIITMSAQIIAAMCFLLVVLASGASLFWCRRFRVFNVGQHHAPVVDKKLSWEGEKSDQPDIENGAKGGFSSQTEFKTKGAAASSTHEANLPTILSAQSTSAPQNVKMASFASTKDHPVSEIVGFTGKSQKSPFKIGL